MHHTTVLTKRGPTNEKRKQCQNGTKDRTTCLENIWTEVKAPQPTPHPLPNLGPHPTSSPTPPPHPTPSHTPTALNIFYNHRLFYRAGVIYVILRLAKSLGEADDLPNPTGLWTDKAINLRLRTDKPCRGFAIKFTRAIISAIRTRREGERSAAVPRAAKGGGGGPPRPGEARLRFEGV